MVRRALITGGNRGIGFATAEALLDQGLDVTITARTEADGEAAAAALGCGYLIADLTRPETLHELIGEEFDILINNAGILPEGSLIENPEGFFQAMAVMVNAPFLLIRALSPGMAERGYGRIVNVSSGWGSFAAGLEGPNAYGIAKAALNALTKTLPRDLPDCILINAADPGWVNTRMGGAQAPTTAEEAADTICWLATLPDDGPTGGFFHRREPTAW